MVLNPVRKRIYRVLTTVGSLSTGQNQKATRLTLVVQAILTQVHLRAR
jgi:hypothetical protein